MPRVASRRSLGVGFSKVLTDYLLGPRYGRPLDRPTAVRVVIRQRGRHETIHHVRSAHHRTSSVVPSARRRWMAPVLTGAANVIRAQATSDTRASRSVGDMRISQVSVDRAGASSYFTSTWAVVGSYVIEPTGPMKGPNAVADVMPLGGRQMLW